MLRKAVAAILALALPAPAAAQEPAEPPMRLEGMEPWGQLIRAMAPNFSKALLASKVSGHVDVVGRLNVIGMLEDVEYTPGNPESKPLVAPLSGVMEFWRFRVPTDHECQPVPTVIRNRVWVDLSGDQPSMKISALHDPNARQPVVIKPLHREEPAYPRSMLQRAWQALVYAAVDIDPAGNVVRVASVAYPKKRGVNLEPFEEEVNRALAGWKFPAAAEGRTRNRRGCYEILFRLQD